jgi:VWFA-related protein
MRQFITALFLTSLVCAPLSVLGQTVGQNKSPQDADTMTLSVGTQLVAETVIVKDKQGNPVPGLSAKDFTITEDGVPQKIRFCEHQSLPTNPVPLAPSNAAQEDIKIYKRLDRTQITQEQPGNIRYKDRRLLVLFFNMSSMPHGDQLRVFDAAKKFVRTQLTEVDLVSLMRYENGSVDILQDFTTDRNKLLSILETLVVGEGQGEAESAGDAGSADLGAAFGQDDTEFNVFNTDRQLSALQTAAKMLGQLNEKKQLIYFSSGLRLNGIDNQAQLHATVDEAVRSGVSLWPIDARGLVAAAPLGDAAQGSPGNQGMYTGAAATAVATDFQGSQDTLFALAGDTGGKALLDYNDLTRGMVEAQRATSDYYIVEYHTSNTSLDGRFRHVKITLNADPNAKLDYRQGYYAGKDFGKFNASDKERQLEDALMLEDPITELTIAMEINYFKINGSEYFVPIFVKIPGRELALARRGGSEHTLIDFVGEIKDAYGGTTVTNVRDNMSIPLSGKTAEEVAHHPIEYNTGFTLLPGKYMIKLLARDNETGRIGTFQTVFTIPNLDKEEQHVPLSSIVLSGERKPLTEALYNAGKTKDQAKATTANPLVIDGQILVPSVTRVFSISRNLYVYLQGYEQDKAGKPLVGFVSIYNGQGKAFESQLITATPAKAGHLTPVQMSFTVNPQHLSPGEYNCQVTVLDPSGNKSTFWKAPIRLVP